MSVHSASRSAPIEHPNTQRRSADALSEILSGLTVDRVMPLRVENGGGAVELNFESYQHFELGVVLSGSCKLCVEEAAPLRLDEGDCYLLTDGRPYRVLGPDHGAETGGGSVICADRGTDGVGRPAGVLPHVNLIGARFTFDPNSVAWLRTALPPMIHIAAGGPQAHLLHESLSRLNEESGSGAPGEAVMIDCLASIILIQVIRARWTADPSQKASSWLAGSTVDLRIGRALRNFHADIAANWTVAALASAAGMSRSSFAQRFRGCIGLSPIEYVARWRIYRVRRDLLETDLAFPVIAARNGYRSRTSCSQAFKRIYGCSPSTLRLGRKSSAASLKLDTINHGLGRESS